MDNDFESLNGRIIRCHRCPRLVEFRENVPLKLAVNEKPWRRPVPGFGDPKAWLMILGLAPSIQGANRTGRAFTGDESAKFLIKMLYKAEMASQPSSTHKNDGLILKGCYLTASVKCVPPQHKPLKQEFINCASYFENELALLTQCRVLLALGKHAFDTYQSFLKKEGAITSKEPFSHGKLVLASPYPALIASYHPSPQNTYTGTLTEEMFLSILNQAQKLKSDSAQN